MALTLLVTGTPGTGKTALAKALGKKLRAKVLNEKEFCQKATCAKWNPKLNEWEIDLKKYKNSFSIFLKLFQKEFPQKMLILEGHVACEVALPVSHVLVLRCNPTELGFRLAKRNYSELKIQENIFCEEENYCFMQAKKHYARKPLLQVQSDSLSLSQSVQKVTQWFKQG